VQCVINDGALACYSDNGKEVKKWTGAGVKEEKRGAEDNAKLWAELLGGNIYHPEVNVS
jgi:hypothetical protein